MKTDAILSKREREVMNLVVLGYSAREIAERMNVIYQCVANHLQSIYDKTGTKRTLQALVTWYFTQNFGITLNVSEMTRRVGAGGSAVPVLGGGVQYGFRMSQVGNTSA